MREYVALINKLKLKNDTLKLKNKILEENINKLKDEYEKKIKDLQNKEEKYIEIIKLKDKDISNLKFKLNNIIKNNFDKSKEEQNQLKKYKKIHSMKLSVKSKANYFSLESSIDNKKNLLHPNSARNNNNSYIMQIKKLDDLNEKNLFNRFGQYNMKYNVKYIKKEGLSTFRKIKNRFFNIIDSQNKSQIINKSNSKDFMTYYPVNDNISENKEKINNKINKNKILLLPRNSNIKLKRTFSAINKSDKNESNYDFLKRLNLNDSSQRIEKLKNSSDIIINAKISHNRNYNLIFKNSTKNSVPNISEYNKMNKFRINNNFQKINNKDILSYQHKEKDEANKLIDKNNDFYNLEQKSLLNNIANQSISINIPAFKLSTKKNKKIKFSK